MKPLLIALLFAVSSELQAAEKQPEAASPSKATEQHDDVRAILEAGNTAHALPPEVVVRVSADLATAVPSDAKLRSDEEARGVDFSKHLKETWEFTANHVHRIVMEKYPHDVGENFDSIPRRVDSRPFDTMNLCKELLDGKLFALGADREGELRQFVGTQYNIGGRAIEVIVNGKSALWKGEHCTGAGYHERDAIAFAALYEKLAKQARAAFETKAR